MSRKEYGERQINFNSAKEFIGQVQPGAWIFRGRLSPNDEPTEYGQTIRKADHIYDNLESRYVDVTLVNNTPGWSGVWFWADARPLTPQELEDRGLLSSPSPYVTIS